MYAAIRSGLHGDPPLLDRDTLARFTTPHSTGTDLVTGEADHVLLGFEAPAVRYPPLHLTTGGASVNDPSTVLEHTECDPIGR